MISLKTNIEQLTALLSASGHGPQVYYQPLPPAQWAESLWQSAQTGEVDLISIHRDEHLSALASVRPLDWDTSFFGFPCARIDALAARGDTMERFTAAREAVKLALERCRIRGIRFLSTKLPGPDPALVQALESNGFYTTCVNLCLSWTGHTPPDHPLPPGFHFADSVPDAPGVAATFRNLFYDGRFHCDPRIQQDTADRLWETAILNQLEKEASHRLFVQKEDRTVGLATIKSMNDSAGSLFIFGIDAGYRGIGLGKALLTELLKRHQSRFNRLDVETSSFNLPAVRTYQGCGFRTMGGKAALHWWRNED